MSSESHFVADLTWDVVRDRLAAGAPAVLPIGAGCKEHGYHLPLATDQRQAEWFARETAQRCGGLIWPTLTYAYYPAFTAYAGSVSLSRTSFEAVVIEIVDALLAQTSSSVLVLDTGVSTIEPVAEAVARTTDPGRVLHIPVYLASTYSAVRRGLMQQAAGTHADEIETSIMLAMDARLVDMARAEASPPGRGLAPLPLSPDDPNSANYAPSGSYGDPALATAAKGRDLLAAILKDIEAACRLRGLIKN